MTDVCTNRQTDGQRRAAQHRVDKQKPLLGNIFPGDERSRKTPLFPPFRGWAVRAARHAWPAPLPPGRQPRRCHASRARSSGTSVSGSKPPDVGRQSSGWSGKAGFGLCDAPQAACLARLSRLCSARPPKLRSARDPRRPPARRLYSCLLHRQRGWLLPGLQKPSHQPAPSESSEEAGARAPAGARRTEKAPQPPGEGAGVPDSE